MILRYTERAINDVEIAFEWYEMQRTGLGFDFLDSLENSLTSILEHPRMYESGYANFRRCVISRFPFSIYYTIENEEIVVHSVFDNRQNPERQP